MRRNDNPFEGMERMFEQMRRSMWGTNPGFEARGRSLPAGSDWDQDRADVGFDANVSMESVDGGYVVYADLPGFEKSEIELRFDDGVLRIEGTHEMTDDEGFRSRRVSERLTVPGDVREAEIEATYRNGVLEVHLPIEEETDDARRIDID